MLKPGGNLILTAPFCSITHQAPYFYHTGYSQFFYEYWCRELNLTILELEENGNYFEYLAQEVSRINTISGQFSNRKMNYIERRSISILLAYLEKCSKDDVGSKGLLCYGYHLLAEKHK